MKRARDDGPPELSDAYIEAEEEERLMAAAAAKRAKSSSSSVSSSSSSFASSSSSGVVPMDIGEDVLGASVASSSSSSSDFTTPQQKEKYARKWGRPAAPTIDPTKDTLGTPPIRPHNAQHTTAHPPQHHQCDKAGMRQKIV